MASRTSSTEPASGPRPRIRAGVVRRLRRLRREEGAVVPMVAIMLITILGMAAFAIDLSGWYFSQRHLQMQADSAVLAGASAFVQGTGTCSTQQSQVQQTASNYVGLGSSGISSNN